MHAFYSGDQRALQSRFETTGLADTLEAAIVSDRLGDDDRAFVEIADFFFLSTVDGSGFPTVSYKGGAPGFVAVIDPATLAFPSYDGNGMYYSMGNIAETARLGMLFIDFVRPRRLRIQATATVSDDDELMEAYPGAQLIVRASITETWGNCPRYIHRHERVKSSKYVPGPDGTAPLPPWKRIETLAAGAVTDRPGPGRARGAARTRGLRTGAGGRRLTGDHRAGHWKRSTGVRVGR